MGALPEAIRQRRCLNQTEWQEKYSMRFLMIAAAVLVIPWLLFWLNRRRTSANLAVRAGKATLAHRETRHGRRQRGFIHASRGGAERGGKKKGPAPGKSNGPSGPIRKPWGW